ncbi:MAG: RNA pseudouridine synthase [Saprospiraceae bacterium]|nr:RNA pseudouridine synthase [Saprospiraceae bacterium]
MNQNFSRNNNLLQISPQVLYEDNHLIAINKPAGLLVHGDVTGDVTAADWVKAYIKKKYNKPGEVFLGVAHRIDRPVSGVLLFARTSKALARINAAFQEHAVQKTYLAVTKKRPPATNGTLKNYLAKDHTANIVKIVPIKNIGAKEAVLEYTALQEANGFHLIKINPITGRPHQIRCSCAVWAALLSAI